jgi:hypothetical protein
MTFSKSDNFDALFSQECFTWVELHSFFFAKGQQKLDKNKTLIMTLMHEYGWGDKTPYKDVPYLLTFSETHCSYLIQYNSSMEFKTFFSGALLQHTTKTK